MDGKWNKWSTGLLFALLFVPTWVLLHAISLKEKMWHAKPGEKRGDK